MFFIIKYVSLYKYNEIFLDKLFISRFSVLLIHSQKLQNSSKFVNL